MPKHKHDGQPHDHDPTAIAYEHYHDGHDGRGGPAVYDADFTGAHRLASRDALTDTERLAYDDGFDAGIAWAGRQVAATARRIARLRDSLQAGKDGGGD